MIKTKHNPVIMHMIPDSSIDTENDRSEINVTIKMCKIENT